MRINLYFLRQSRAAHFFMTYANTCVRATKKKNYIISHKMHTAVSNNI